MENKSIYRSSFQYNFLKQIIIRLDFQGVLQSEMEEVLIKVKPYLKERKFNRYEQKISNEIDINNSIFQSNSSIQEVRHIILYSFINEDKGYTIDLSTNYICFKVNAAKYISFEEYSEIFMDIADIYGSAIDFFTVKRFGLRKINFCFLTKINCINKYFTQRYFDYYDLFGDAEIFASEKKENFAIDNCKINLLCDIEQGQLGEQEIYKITLDSDVYIDNTENIEKTIFADHDIDKLNDRLFAIYVHALTEEFGNMLLNEKTLWPEEILGVERNE